MARYFSTPKQRRETSYWDEPVIQPLGHPTVFVSDPVDTGLVDQNGNRIFRTADQIGFVRRAEE